MNTTGFLIVKYLITAAIVVLVSELARHSGRLGALIGALPTVAILTLIWLNVEQQPRETISDYAWYTLWYVIPTLPMFLLFPFVHEALGFWKALLLSSALTLVSFGLFGLLLKRFGIHLF